MGYKRNVWQGTYIEPELLARVKEIGLFEYLQASDPGRLVKIGGGTYCLADHDSLKISRGKWCWWSHHIGGRSALDFLIKVDSMEFMKAAWQIIGVMGLDAALENGNHVNPENGKWVSPEREKTEWKMPAVRAPIEAKEYLLQRGISEKVVDYFIEKKLILETYDKRNVLFMGRDENGKYVYGAKRSITSTWKGEVEGSDKRFAFKYISPEKNPELHLFEGAVDMLSFATIHEDVFRTLNLLSQGGVYFNKHTADYKLPLALEYCLLRYSWIKKIILHLDNDNVGRRAAEQIAVKLAALGIEVVDEVPEGAKDVNEMLLLYKRWGNLMS